MLKEAKEVKSGNPITAPMATTQTERLSFLLGTRCLVRDRATRAMPAAMTVRAVPAKRADIPSLITTKRVSGTVKEKAVTPTSPQAIPALPAGIACLACGVALSCILMTNDSTSSLIEVLKEKVHALKPGQKFPSTRQLVEEFHVSPVTVQKALKALVYRNLIETRPGVGTFVLAAQSSRRMDVGWQISSLGQVRQVESSSLVPMDNVTDISVDLKSGYPERSLQAERLVRSAIRAAVSDPSSFDVPDPRGHVELRAWCSREANISAGKGATDFSKDDVVILPGSQQGLTTLFRSVVGPGNSAVMESPTYWGAILAARRADVRIVPVATGPDGPDPQDVEEAMASSGAKVFYAQPSFSNPSGGSWSQKRAKQIIEIVERHRAFLIEDDWAHDFDLTGGSCPLRGMDSKGSVIYVRSLTKSLSPAVRVAAIIAHGPVRERIFADIRDHNLFVSPVLQNAAYQAVTSPQWKSHTRKLKQELRFRRDALMETIKAHGPDLQIESIPKGGLNLWVRLPDLICAASIVERCEREGVGLADGSSWFPSERSGEFIRLNYAACNPELYEKAITTVQRCISESFV